VNSGAKEPKTINATSGSISTVCHLSQAITKRLLCYENRPLPP